MRRTLFAIAGLLLVTGCTGMPETTRTSAIHEVNFEENLTPADLTVHVGDEVRWVNHRTLPVRIDIAGLNRDMLTCERNFSNFFGTLSETAEVAAGKTASLCFRRGMVINYNVRMESAVPGGMVIQPGTIRVAGPVQPIQ